MKKIVVTREIFDDAIEYLEQHFSVVSNQQDRPYTRDELINMMQGTDGVQTYSNEA